MNLDDLLKSIREEDDDSKGGKINAGKFKTKSFKNPLVGQKFKAPGLPTERPVVIKVEPTKLIPKDEGASKELIESINQLVSVIKDDNDLEKQRQDYEKKQEAKEKRQKREERIEGVKKILGITRTTKKAIKKVQDIFDTVIRFLGFTLLGQIVKFVTDFLGDPKNKKFLEDAQNFIRGIPDKLREVRDKLIPVVDWFKEQGPKILKFAEDFRKLLTRFPFLGQIFKTEQEKEAGLPPAEGLFTTPGNFFGFEFPIYSLPSFKGGFGFSEGGMISMGTDTVPAMLTPGEFVMSRGAVNKFGVDTLMAMNKAGGGTNRPKFGLVSGFSGGGFTRDVTKLLENYEGLRLNAYPDPASGGEPITIGVGATRYPPGFRFGRSKVMLGDTITKEEAYMIKDYDVKRHTKIAKDRVGHEMWPKLPENVKFALISKAFNYGTVYNSTLRELDKGVESGDYSALAAHYRNVLAKHNNGINSWRRNDEAGIIASGKSKRSGMTFSTSLSAPPVTPPPMPSTIPDGSSFGPGFDSNDRAQSERLNLIKLMYKNRAKQSTNRFSGFDLDFIFKPIRQFLGIDTPNAPTSSKIIVLPAVKQTAQQSGTQVDNDIPNFRISSGVKMRGLVGKALGIEDLVS